MLLLLLLVPGAFGFVNPLPTSKRSLGPVVTRAPEQQSPTSLSVGNFFSGAGAKKAETVVVPRDFTLCLVISGLAALADQVPWVQIILGVPLTAFAVLLFVQTVRIRFVFEDKDFGIKASQQWTAKDALSETGENYIIGGIFLFLNVFFLETYYFFHRRQEHLEVLVGGELRGLPEVAALRGAAVLQGDADSQGKVDVERRRRCRQRPQTSARPGPLLPRRLQRQGLQGRNAKERRQESLVSLSS